MRGIRIIALLLLTAYGCTTFAMAGGGLGGGATEFTQQLNNAELVKAIEKAQEQIKFLEDQLRTLDNVLSLADIDNMLQGPMQIYSKVTGIYRRVKGILDKTRGLTYTVANLDEELKRRFKSYGDMAMASNRDFAEESRSIAETQMETVRSTLKGIHVAWDQFQDDTKTLEQIQDVAKSAKGRNQIEQARNQLLGFLGEELMRLRQMTMMQAQMAGVALEAERAKEDARQKRLEAFFKPASPSDVKGPAFESLADLF